MLLRFPKAVLLSVLLLLGSQISSLTILSQEVEPSSPVTNTAELPSSSLPEPYSLVEPFVSSSGESIVEPSEDSSSSELSTEPSLTEPSSTPNSSSQSSTSASSSELEEVEEETESSGSQPIYRLYNPGTGKHLYTTDDNERKVLYEQHGWGYEGIGWYAPRKGVAVYRLYNPGLKNHLYTTDTNEVRVLTSHHGWKADNNGRPVFASGGTVNIYRLYNARLSGRHHWTTDTNEYNVLPSHGWRQEGVKFLAAQVGKPIRTQYYINKVLNITAIANGDFSSLEGTWKNGFGSRVSFSKTTFLGEVQSNRKYHPGLSWPSFHSGVNGNYLSGNFKSKEHYLFNTSVLIIPRTVAVYVPNTSIDRSDTTRDRLILGGTGAPTPNQNPNYYYYRDK